MGLSDIKLPRIKIETVFCFYTRIYVFSSAITFNLFTKLFLITDHSVLVVRMKQYFFESRMTRIRIHHCADLNSNIKTPQKYHYFAFILG